MVFTRHPTYWCHKSPSPLAVVEHLAASSSNYLAVNAALAEPLPAGLIDRVDLFMSTRANTPSCQNSTTRVVAVTYGADGAACSRTARRSRAAGGATSAVNTVGAGDAFCAALVIALHTGMTPTDALQSACSVGAAAVAHPASQPALRLLSSTPLVDPGAEAPDGERSPRRHERVMIQESVTASEAVPR